MNEVNCNFTPFPKIPRLFKDVVITEKIDGTNGGIRITGDGRIYAQSKKRDLPMGPKGMDDIDWEKRDNHGFAAWVREHKEQLIEVLGPGIHFGEWWGHGINRGYGLKKGGRRFSLFNLSRWGHFADPELAPDIPGLGVVPNLGTYRFSVDNILRVYDDLMEAGSWAAPDYGNPEGIVVYHTAAKALFKVTDPYKGEAPKGARLKAVA